MNAVCLMSGGLDSFVAAAVAREAGHTLHALTVDYGQRHRKEIRSARKIASFLNVKEHKLIRFDLSWLPSALTSDDAQIPADETPEEIPPTYVPARNTILISLALAYAESADAGMIFLGVNSRDYSGYPDCRPEYLAAFQQLVSLATKKTVGGNPIVLEAPLISLRKSEIILLGLRLGLDFSLSWSCYRGGRKACGRCPSCRIRLKGFEEAGVKDPVAYVI